VESKRPLDLGRVDEGIILQKWVRLAIHLKVRRRLDLVLDHKSDKIRMDSLNVPKAQEGLGTLFLFDWMNRWKALRRRARSEKQINRRIIRFRKRRL
jgi:hypothetical protein